MADPRRVFTMQKLNAKRRGIPFRLTFISWWEIWSDSGHFSARGRGKGQYVMARFKDRGAYEVGNVEIVRFEDNIKATFQNLSPAKQAAWRARGVKAGRANKDRPRPDLARLNKSRAGMSLAPAHREKIAAGMRGKKRGPYKTWKGLPR